MKLKAKYWLPALSLGLLLFAAPSMPVAAMGVVSGPTVIYVHGFNFGVRRSDTVYCQNKSSCPSYWGSQDTSSPVVHVGYDGRHNPLRHGGTRGVTRMLQVLNKHCRRDQQKACRIVNHSMGGLITGYVVANYNRDNTYNIHYVSSIVSAEGGSELASVGDPILRVLSALTFGLTDWILQFPSAVRILAIGNARRAYDHNRNNGILFYHIAGHVKYRKIHPISWIFHGSHDTVVAMHTTCSYRDVKDFNRCGGQTITTGALWWKKKKTYAPHTGHKPHPRHNNYGVKVKHTEFPDKAAYTKAAL
jgi:hypothetical protein